MPISKRSSSDPLLPRIRRAAAGTNGITFVGSAGGPESSQTVSWGEMHKEALAVAAALQNRGIKPGDNIALLGLTSRELVTAMQGVWLTGACVNMLPIPMRMNSIAEFALQTRAHLSYSDARMLLLDPGLAALYEAETGDPPIVLFDD
jgi:fatty-acyl-CoA synthase